MKVAVECSRDAHGDERPERVAFDGRTVAVAEILDRWPSHDYCYFKFKGDDGAIYVIRHDEASARWELTLFQRGDASASSRASGV